MKALIEISVCSACVSACPYCIAKGTVKVPYSKHLQAEGGGVYLDPMKLLDFCSEILDAHDGEIVFALTGGEPMCHPAFMQIMSGLKLTINDKKHKAKIALYSNLKLLNGAKAHLISMYADLVIAGYHPGQDAFCSNRKWEDPKTAEDFGSFRYTNREWLKERLGRLQTKTVVNYIVGAYGEDLHDFETWALQNKIAYVKTPLDSRIGLNGVHFQLGNAPDMLAIRADGTIIRCSGKPEAIGSIYEDKYSKEMLCKANCALCPSFYCFLGNEHLFKEGI